MSTQESKSRFGMALVGWAVLCGLLLFLVLDRAGSSAPSNPVPVAEGGSEGERWQLLERRIATLEERLLELERRPVAAAPVPQAGPGEGEQRRDEAAPGPGTGPAEPSEPWSPRPAPETISGKPEEVSVPVTARSEVEASFPDHMKEVLEKVERHPFLAEWEAERSREEAKAADADAASTTAASGDGPEEGVATTVTDDEEASATAGAEAEALVALNRLLADTGLHRYQALTLELPEGSGLGLRGVSLVERGESGETTGSLHAGRMRLRYFEPRRAKFVLEECYGTRGAVRIEFPRRVLEIEVPGLLDPGLVEPVIAAHLWEPETELSERAVTAAQSALFRLNDVLGTIENVALRLRSVKRLQHGTLVDVVIDLEFDGEGQAVRTIRAKSAWWELHEGAACVRLHCEGGELVVGGKSRPLFRGRFSHTIGNVQPKVWSRLPAVRVVSEENGADSAGQ